MSSYPAVYIICILPTSVSRFGSGIPYQFTLFGSTVFSFCGLFDAILFFLTRPDLVVGTTDSAPLPPAPVINTQSEHSGDVELPFTRNPTTSDYIPLDVERGRNSQFQPYNQMLHPEDAGSTSNRHMSPQGRRQSYLGENEEEYGHLPVR